MLHDRFGHPVAGATPEALAAFEQALDQFHCYAGNPVATAKAAAAAPDFAMAHLLVAALYLSGMEAAGLAPARAALDAARLAIRTERERRHMVALDALARGCFDEAAEGFDDLTIAHPRDLLALQMGHLLDFYRGDARSLRDRIVRVLPAWNRTMPNFHAVKAMLAFGLEETGDYAAAEAAGREACDLNPRDAWAHHAVCHVLEMQGRTDEGIRWARKREEFWAPDNMFAVHNWWHLALYHLDRDEHDTVLGLYDGAIRGGRSPVVLDMVDASAMLWRLHLRGVAPGTARWAEIAGAWEPLRSDGFYAFNDVHGLMAFLGAGRTDLVRDQVAALRRSAAADPASSNTAMAAEVGLPVAEALLAFEAGDWAGCITRLRRVRGIAHRFGGSHAQRDLLDLTLIEAARRAKDPALLAALSAERLRAKPQNPLAQRYATALPFSVAA